MDILSLSLSKVSQCPFKKKVESLQFGNLLGGLVLGKLLWVIVEKCRLSEDMFGLLGCL